MYSITHGYITFEEMFKIIKAFIKERPDMEYHISIGTDSQNHDLTKTIRVVAVHRVGNGGIFFYEEKKIKKITNLHQKLLYETNASLSLAARLAEKFKNENFNYEISIHVDAGSNGPSKKMIPEISAWVRACGFDCKTKPESYTASSIANKYSK